MGATQTTPNPNGNPFDVPLNSEIEESKQRQQAAQKSNPDDYNPFDEPLASEVAEQKMLKHDRPLPPMATRLTCL